MATHPITRKWTVPAGGSATVRSIINDTTRGRWVTYIHMRAEDSNAAAITWEDAQGEAGGYLLAGDAANLGDELGHPNYLDFVLRGTADDALYMTIGTSACDG